MQSVKSQINDFLEKCREVRNCKFIVAPTKIKDLLKSIVNSQELYELFNTVSADFDYLSAKKRCLVTISDGISQKSYLALPETVGDRLAFIFCLLVEFDRDSINFNWFLQTYFSDDGSYFSGYQAFCEAVIGSLEQIVKEVFAKELQEEALPEQTVVAPEVNGALPAVLSAISLLIAQEKQFIFESGISNEEKEVGYKMLDEIANSVKSGNSELLNALALGYNYFVLYNNIISDGLQSLFEEIQRFESLI